MKHIIIIFCAIFFFSSAIDAQQSHGPMKDSKFRDKIEQLEKIKTNRNIKTRRRNYTSILFAPKFS